MRHIRAAPSLVSLMRPARDELTKTLSQFFVGRSLKVFRLVAPFAGEDGGTTGARSCWLHYPVEIMADCRDVADVETLSSQSLSVANRTTPKPDKIGASHDLFLRGA